ncbi:hypothetical protein [Arthrobacter methylotrophus]|uniref:Uncharacterized protein n=2 Tax=Arthrobacter methylotrophus TaxID=121291 RepID=A0ABV5UN75_9MICC
MSTSALPSQPSVLHGIVVEECLASQVQLHFLDPSTGTELAPVRIFTGTPGFSIEACTPNTVSLVLERIRRNLFSPDLSMLADSQTSEQITHIGYIPQGQAFVDLSPAKGSNYAAKTPSQTHPEFNPVDGRLWFYDETTQHLDSVDPRLGPSSVKQETDPVGGTSSTLDFEFDNAGRPLYTDPSSITTLDGQWMLLNDAAQGWSIVSAPQAHQPDATRQPVQPDSSVKAPGCEPVVFIDNLRFICTGGGTLADRNNIYITALTPDHSGLSQTALLPPSENRVDHVMASPDGKEIAFLSGSTLYVTSSTSQQEPRKVADLQGPDSRLVAWQ